MLSPGTGQVTHALLTRPPLTWISSIRKLPTSKSVRLACVKHAASVHPEPGSNSHVDSFSPASLIWHQFLNWFLSVNGFYCFGLWSSFPLPLSIPLLFRSLFFFSEFFQSLFQVSLKRFLEFSGLHYCLFVKVLSISNQTSKSDSEIETEKEGFEPSRRVNDLHP